MTERGCYYTDECNSYMPSYHKGRLDGEDMPDDFPGPRNLDYRYEGEVEKYLPATWDSPEEGGNVVVYVWCEDGDDMLLDGEEEAIAEFLAEWIQEAGEWI